MKVFLDTSVLVAACVEDHEHNARATPVLQDIHAGKMEGFVSAHGLVETYSVLTRLPRSPRISSTQAATLVRENITNHFTVITLNAKEYNDLVMKFGSRNIMGGKAYDALHLECASKCNVDRIYTFNLRDFIELSGPLSARIASP